MKLAVTVGDINGVGLEVFVKALHSDAIKKYKGINYYLIGNAKAVADYIELNNSRAEVEDNLLKIGEIVLPIVSCGVKSPVRMGQTSKSAGELAAAAIEQAAKAVFDGKYDAMLTLPISKEAIKLAGIKFPGHTEFIADICGQKYPLMILCNEQLRVALATVHIPIRDVHYNLNTSDLVRLATKFHASLEKDYGKSNPSIAVLGLNPHAGENGYIGDEEKLIISPAIELLKNRGLKVDGPFPSDGFFAHGEYKNYDGVFAMYHDQGLIPLKLLANGGGVNYTAGLPIVRTSPDHGTAFGIAGKNIADPQSTIDAIELAFKISNNRKKDINE